jgi:hypothetical protein
MSDRPKYEYTPDGILETLRDAEFRAMHHRHETKLEEALRRRQEDTQSGKDFGVKIEVPRAVYYPKAKTPRDEVVNVKFRSTKEVDIFEVKAPGKK